ncbi:MAG: O-antigen ligase family protein [Betaproteobacteria bacterium]|nr:O-antigen ligase family protein [Betaproteobacteria bacterium]
MIRDRLDLASKWLVVAVAFSVPLPAAWISVTTGLFLLVWAISGDFEERWKRIVRHRVAAISLALFAWMGFTMLWSPAALRPSSDDWWHYRELLLIPLAISVIDNPIWCRRIFFGFLCGFGIALVTSFLRWFGVLHDMGGLGPYAGFGGHTGFSTMLAFVGFACIWLARKWPAQRWAWYAFGIVCVGNLFFINTGRTGHIIFLALLPLLAYSRFRFKGVALGLIAACIAAGALYGVSPRVKDRTDEMLSDARKFHQHGDTTTNDGLRVGFWLNTVELIERHPGLGGGMGSFRPEYRALAEQKGLTGNQITPNPHNEYLLVWSQTGIIGLGLLLWLWAAQWRYARGLGQCEGYLTHGLLVAMIVGDIFNSFILDNLEGHFYALLTAALAYSWPRGEADAKTI